MVRIRCWHPSHQVVQLLKAGKGKEVSYNALATHIIAEDGDNPEVGESREVFDLPVVKVNTKLHWRVYTFIHGTFTEAHENAMCVLTFASFSAKLGDTVCKMWRPATVSSYDLFV